MTPPFALPHQRRALLALCTALLPWSVPARAAEEDTQLWFFFNSIVPLPGDATGTFEISPRAREEEGDFLLTRFTVEVPATEWAVPGAGAAYIESEVGHEWRAHQQLTLSAGPVSFRTRVEERFLEDQPRAQLRLRERVATAIPVAEHTTITGSAELLYIARTEDPEDEARVDSWRANVGVQQRLDPQLTVGLNYLMILVPREDAPDRISHVPQVTLVFRPG